MKTFNAKIQLFHESFSGYDHNDGYIDRQIDARDADSARRKLKRILDKEYNDGRRWYDIVCIWERK